MDPSSPLRLPPPLAAAAQRVRLAARTAAEQAVDSLGLAALACAQALRRDLLLSAQHELNRQLAVFTLAFNQALDAEVARQTGGLTPTPPPSFSADGLMAAWESFSLVDDHALELHISADRLAMDIGHACEWVLREFDGYMATLLQLDSPDHGRNPLRAEVVAQALMQALDALATRPELHEVLADEVGRALARAMPATYEAIVAELRARGLRPAGLAVKTARAAAGPAAAHADPAPPVAPATPAAATGHPTTNRSGQLGPDGHRPTGPGAPPDAAGAAHATGTSGGLLGSVDSGLMQLIRHLHAGPATAAAAADGPGDMAWPTGHEAEGAAAVTASGGVGLPNLIALHREALRAASPAPLNHLLIDLVAALFDQILADPQVPPQFARQIARLQMPVLRAALGDTGFFASRRHPVRRLINRIASLAAACGEGLRADADTLLAEVATRVQAVVEGDFDRAEVYEQQLALLERAVAQGDQALQPQWAEAGALLARKEQEQRALGLFRRRLAEALAPLPMPHWLRAFVTGPWAQVIVRCTHKEGPDSPLVQRLRETGRDLVMSVQPQGGAVQRQQFLRQLPGLMKRLALGLDHARCTETARRDFFARLAPAHAEALQQPALRTLDHNLMLRQVGAALDLAVPLPGDPELAAAPLPAALAGGPAADGEANTDRPVGHDDSPPLVATLDRPDGPALVVRAGAPHALRPATADQDPSGTPPADAGAATTRPDDLAAAAAPPDAPLFSPAEAQAVGLVSEQAVHWDAGVDIDLSVPAPVTAVDIAVDGLPAPDAPEPSQGRLLLDHARAGLAYLMQLGSGWQQVQLSHISPGGGFFLFTHGHQQLQSVSMTRRMLQRLCDAGRFRALENATLIERATARARRQLAELARKPAPGTAAGA